VSDSEITDELNYFFSNIGKQLASKFDDGIEPDDQQIDYGHATVISDVFMLQHVDQARILQLITQINSQHKASGLDHSGLDHISVKFAKSISQNIAYSLCKLFNQSFDVGKVPDHAIKIRKDISVV